MASGAVSADWLSVEELRAVARADEVLARRGLAHLVDNGGGDASLTRVGHRMLAECCVLFSGLHGALEARAPEERVPVKAPEARLDSVAAMVAIGRAFPVVYRAAARGTGEAALARALLGAAEAQRRHADVLEGFLPRRRA